MLQITTGKLFTLPTGRENCLRGVLFTNLFLGRLPDKVLAGPLFGRIVQASDLSATPKTLVYEFTERIEAPQAGLGVIVSHGADPYLQDMATVVSFALSCTCSPDIDLVRRLTSGERGLATGQAPSRFIPRVFDKEVFSQPAESDEFVRFVNSLLGLQRETYLGVMRAIRTYVTGLHRVADDLELAYTLMVAAGESLAQDFDGHTSDWESVAQQKRDAIDEALIGAEDNLAQRVREAVLSYEHTALARRFQAFVTANVAPEYFLGPYGKDSYPVGRSDLPEVLAAAYKARSQYVHQLQRLPDMVTLGNGHLETTIVGRCKMLTLGGLSRLMRHIIMTFVQRQPTVETEFHDYSAERAGVVQVRLAPSFWLAHADGDISKLGRDKFEGFLEELTSAVMRVPDATITDISEVLRKFVVKAPTMKMAERRPYFALLALFNAVAGEKSIRLSPTMTALIEKDLSVPSSEALLAFAFLEQVPEWSLDDHSSTFQNYKRRRGHKNGIRFPRLFEAAVALELAERYRFAGLFERCKEVVAEAADDFPEHSELRRWVGVVVEGTTLRWQDVLLPKPAAKESEHSSKNAVGVAGTTSSPPFRKVKRRVRTPEATKTRRRRGPLR